MEPVVVVCLIRVTVRSRRGGIYAGLHRASF